MTYTERSMEEAERLFRKAEGMTKFSLDDHLDQAAYDVAMAVNNYAATQTVMLTEVIRALNQIGERVDWIEQLLSKRQLGQVPPQPFKKSSTDEAKGMFERAKHRTEIAANDRKNNPGLYHISMAIHYYAAAQVQLLIEVIDAANDVGEGIGRIVQLPVLSKRQSGQLPF
jgi:hypothetical protein